MAATQRPLSKHYYVGLPYRKVRGISNITQSQLRYALAGFDPVQCPFTYISETLSDEVATGGTMKDLLPVKTTAPCNCNLLCKRACPSLFWEFQGSSRKALSSRREFPWNSRRFPTSGVPNLGTPPHYHRQGWQKQEHVFFLSPPEGGLDLVTNRQGSIKSASTDSLGPDWKPGSGFM